MKSLRTKFAIGITILIILTVSITGYLMIRKKSLEIKQDIFINARNFAELMVGDTIHAYELYYTSKGFAYFNRDMKRIFSLNNDISNIQIANYSGNILYDSEAEKYEQYKGEERKVTDFTTLQRLQDIKPSILTDTRVVYLKKDAEGSWQYVDRFESPVESIDSSENIVNIMYPYHDNKSRVIYLVSYDNLVARIWDTAIQIFIILAIISLFGIAFGFLLAGTVVNPIQKLTQGVSEIAKGNLQYQVRVETEDEIKTLALAFNKMARDLEISTKAMIEKEKLTKELEIAKKIQQDLLPKSIPFIEDLNIAVSVTPAGQVGGDCYDFLRLDENNILMYIGDVTGHGVPASLVVAITNAVFFTILDYKKTTKDIIVKTNAILKAKTDPTMFVTTVLCDWNSLNKTFTYSSAGHEQIIHYKAKDKKSVLCPSGGLALGMLPDIEAIVEEKNIDLVVNDFLVLYSDGIPEAWRTESEMLGMQRFQDIINRQDHTKTAQELHDSILKEVNDFRSGYEQMDDITLMVVKRVG